MVQKSVAKTAMVFALASIFNVTGLLPTESHLLPAATAAQEQGQIQEQGQGEQVQGLDAKVSQAEAMKIAMRTFNLPQNLDNAEIGYFTSERFGKTVWYFNWTVPQVEGCRFIRVEVDAQKGSILGYCDYVDTQKVKPGVKPKTEQECAAIAVSMAKKLAPAEFAQCKVEKSPNRPNPEYGPQQYNFYCVRTISGISFPENNIAITVNSGTGAVNEFQLLWEDDLQFPNPAKAISAEKAKQIFRDQIGLRLIYTRRINLLSIYPPNLRGPVELYYTMEDGLYPGRAIPHIDALTGNLVDQTGEKTEFIKEVVYPSIPEPLANLPAAPLSLEEAKTQLNNYDVVTQGMLLQSSQLYPKFGQWGEPVWVFGLDEKTPDNKPTGGYIVYIHALSGELQGFTFISGAPEGLDTRPQKFSYQACEQIAAEFMNKVYGAKAGQFVLSENPIELTPNLYNQEKGMVPPSYTFYYNRLANGIPYRENTIIIQVNNRTGEIGELHSNWEAKVKFDQPENLITEEQAVDILLAANPPRLVFFRKLTATGEPSREIGLTYLFTDKRAELVDAKTGKAVPAWQEEDPVKFTDIKGHPAEPQIRKLGAMGIIDLSPAKFEPNKQITRAEVVKLLATAKDLSADNSSSLKFSDVPKSAWYYGWIQAAVKAGLIQESSGKFNPNQTVTRQELVVMLVRAISTSPIATKHDLLDNYADGDKVAPWAADAYNLALEAGLVIPEKGYIGPNKPVTRGEAAVMLAKTIDIANRYGSGIPINR